MSIKANKIKFGESEISVSHRYAESEGKYLDIVTKISITGTNESVASVSFVVSRAGEKDFSTDNFIEAMLNYNSR